MFGLGSQEIMIILCIAVVIFGAKKLPQIGEGMGKAIKNFKKSATEAEETMDDTQVKTIGELAPGDQETA